MRTERNILIAFLLNISFSIFEIIGGVFTNSIAIISDAIHDLGDAISIGISYLLEKKSRRKPDDKYTYGYTRYSILGAVITNTILILGSALVIYNAVVRIINPIEINYNGMIVFAIVGVIVNFIAVYYTREGNSLNQKAVNLHMLEDVLGWLVVLIGAVVIKFTQINIIDPIMSICVAGFILIHALKSCKTIIELFLEKTPDGIDVDELKEHLLKIEEVKDVHHIHVWSIDGFNNFATMHVIADISDIKNIKKQIKAELKEHNITHTTIEFEAEDEKCDEINCEVDVEHNSEHHHHHHHH